MGVSRREVFVPQSYEWGQEAQVDWYEAQARLDGEARKLYFFSLRSMASGGGFHRAYTNATQQAFLEGHEHAFRYFHGVFATLRYDNLSSAVKKILRGRQREETERIIAFRSHWGFRSEYCTPGRGNEKAQASHCTPLANSWMVSFATRYARFLLCLPGRSSAGGSYKHCPLSL